MILTTITPHAYPVRAGELTILLCEPRGYCALVLSVYSDKAVVRLLDAEVRHIETVWLDDLIPTRKTPLDFLKLYEPTPQTLSRALEKEREQVDFTKLKKRTSKKTGEKKIAKKTKPLVKTLSIGQKDQLKDILMARLKEIRKATKSEKSN